jgi:hypothetical protein
MGITSRGAGRYELWPVLAVGGSAQHQPVVDKRIGGVSCRSVREAASVTARQRIEASSVGVAD